MLFRLKRQGRSLVARLESDAEGFRLRWLAEGVRMREEREGCRDEANMPASAVAADGSGEGVVLDRARKVAHACGLEAASRVWERRWAWSLAMMVALGGLSGWGAALAVLGDGAQPVNVVWVLGGLLGLPTLSLALWMAGIALGGQEAGGLAGRAWSWVQSHGLRSPAMVDLAAGLASLLGRARLARWWLGTITHGVWLAVLCGVILGTLLSFSARRYDFVWETTILSPAVFVALVDGVGYLPARLGFAVPDPELIRASGEQAVRSDAARMVWSSWLLGALTVLGLLPRLLLWALCLGRWRLGQRRVRLDLAAPYYTLLLQRNAPTSARMGVTDEDRHADSPSRVRSSRGQTGRAALVGHELGGRMAWPPVEGRDVRDLGVVEDRAQRREVLQSLRAEPPARLVIVCDERQTPDRGSLEFIAHLASHAGMARVVLAGGAAEYGGAWRERLAAIGFQAGEIGSDLAEALAWLKDSGSERGHG